MFFSHMQRKHNNNVFFHFYMSNVINWLRDQEEKNTVTFWVVIMILVTVVGVLFQFLIGFVIGGVIILLLLVKGVTQRQELIN